MSRIRSVHPGLFTDEAFMQASPLAKVLIIGLWTECDDYGAFEWKPITLKAKILPADNCDAVALLDELASASLDMIKAYEIGGKRYGVVRNFRRWQRPKKPNAVFPIPDHLVEYTVTGSLNGGTDTRSEPPGGEFEYDEAAPIPADGGNPAPSDDASSPLVGNQFGTGGENAPQMEDVGCRRKEERSPDGDPKKSPVSKSRSPPTNNLAMLDAFDPSDELLSRLSAKCPRVADRLANLALQFRTDPWWAKQFAEGKYSDPARCFENFCAKQEAFAADRGVKPKPQQRQRPMAQPPVFGMRPGELLPPVPPDDQPQGPLQ
jgi:hypothetical protein